MNAAQYRKALAVLALAVVQVAAYIVADPTDLPAWVVAAAGLVNTLAVWWVRNDPMPAKHGPVEKFGRQSGVGGFKPPDQPTT